MIVKIKLLFFPVTNQKKYLSRLITWWTNSKFYHVEIIINDTLVSGLNEGVTIRDNAVPDSIHVTKELNINVTKRQYASVMKWVASKEGSKYDYLGILMSTILPARIDNPNKWFCSELTTKILQLLSEEKTYDLVPNMVTPGDLARIYGVENG